jgi:hypothetical protein
LISKKRISNMTAKAMIKIFYGLTAFFACSVSTLYGQCTHKVSHLSASMMVNGVNVTVSQAGIVTSNTVYCPATAPYHIGYDYATSTDGTGSYSFNFSPPVSALTLNFSGISNVTGGSEEVRVFRNGQHFPISSAGVYNSCDKLAVLTSQGNIAGCLQCAVSGWNGTTINGPIFSLKVENTVISGQSGGSIFSLFI